jgi:hypothetical protein
MRAGQCKCRELPVVEPRPLPPVHAVAVFAGDRQPGGLVIQWSGCLIILEMAGHALGAQTRVESAGRAVMAVVTGGGGVSADQREAVVVLLNR